MIKRLVLVVLFSSLGLFAEKVTPLLKLGDVAPTFMLPSLDDKRVSLRDYCGALRQSWKNGKRHIVVLSFMASYCVPCRREIPQLEAYAASKEDDVKILYISVDTLTPDQLLPFTQHMKMKQPVLQDRYGSIMKKYGVQKLPSLFILDKEGTVRYQNLDGLPESVDFVALLKQEVARVRRESLETVAAPDGPAVAPLTVAVKREVLAALLSGKSGPDILKATNVSAEELEAIRREVDSTMRAQWGLKE